MSSTSGSCSSCADAARRARRRVLVRDGDVPVLAREGRDAVAPPELPRDAPVADVRASSRSRSSSRTPGRSASSPSSTASIAGSASGSIFTNHCVERYGSMTVSQRWQWPTCARAARLATRRPSASSRATTRLRASKRSSPANSPASAVILPSGPMTTIAGRPWRCPVAKSLASCAGVTLTTPVPNSRSTRIASATIGMLAAHDRQDRASCRCSVAGSAGPPDGPRAPCRRASSRAASSRRPRPPATPGTS